MSNPAHFDWRYRRGGRVKHALISGGHTEALCGASCIPASDWHGTGSQDEYETAERLRPCRRCLWLLEHQ